MRPQTAFPAAQIVGTGASLLTNTSSAVVGGIPKTASGDRPAFIRVACFSLGAGGTVSAVHFRLAPTASTATCTTSDTIVFSGEGLWMNTLGMNGFAALGVLGNVRVQVTPTEEGVIQSSGQGLAGTG